MMAAEDDQYPKSAEHPRDTGLDRLGKSLFDDRHHLENTDQ
jgi:hypothetical protein